MTIGLWTLFQHNFVLHSLWNFTILWLKTKNIMLSIQFRCVLKSQSGFFWQSLKFSSLAWKIQIYRWQIWKEAQFLDISGSVHIWSPPPYKSMCYHFWNSICNICPPRRKSFPIPAMYRTEVDWSKWHPADMRRLNWSYLAQLSSRNAEMKEMIFTHVKSVSDADSLEQMTSVKSKKFQSLNWSHHRFLPEMKGIIIEIL